MEKILKILLVDDHNLFRRGIKSIIESHPALKVIGEASNGKDAIKKAHELKPDLILMDINMPEMNGLEATKVLIAQNVAAKIIILTVEEEDEILFDAIKHGASGYLLKNLEPEQLINYLLETSNGIVPISPHLATKIIHEFARLSQYRQEHKGDNESTEPKKELSLREKEVLRMVAQGYTNKEIGAALCISENTVRNHLRNILEKLHLENRVQAAAFATREGLI
ncbi:two component transcriptional regulator, LuxR family [Carboxydocella sporoproducens DSM 16521]|uniref:Stage 0 sporulation protein A homolog n=2 Tax=Carboxydocella TaxID=178898 RepID=A0A1T4LLE5_9FIRM|nr:MULTISPECIES: response regulator transcription factor [Carboxydocella]AVX20516.1 two component transcriptional regulator, LuxR family [Carboxydocella thermautotrophica]AVX30938.1 two component transcriptional regulator, LuxR family [Carboxydocella thermautotrophica]SJZ55466.1 two component transcriptional regulator, LuxR family [Carboxydocella sporoproducens DSM 16521]